METEGFGYLPGRFSLSKEKINKIIDILQLDKKAIKQIKKNKKKVLNAVKTGDTQLAKVISLNPLLISCYSDEFESVLIYKYPTDLVEIYKLSEGQILLTSNMYWPKESFALEGDILVKSDLIYNWRDAITFIPLFLCENDEYILELTNKRSKKEMVDLLEAATLEYLEKMPNHIRDGFKSLIYF